MIQDNPLMMLIYSGDYELIVRQQPKEALVAQPGKEKNRKPIDPPPIVQLQVPEVKDPIRQFLQSPYLFMMCHLEPTDTSISSQDAKEGLIGSISSSLHRLKDINNEDGGFFVFGDISVKIPGTHRLRFTLMELQKDEGRVISLRSILSDPFNVVPQKHWRGLEESTYLSRAFSDQGVRLRLRKENRTMSQKRNYQSLQDPQPGPSSAASEQAGSAYGASPVSSHYGFAEGLPKRQRSDDFSQQSMYGAERAVPGYAHREFNPALSSMINYSVQQPAPRQSPQSAYGFQQQPSSSTSAPAYFPHGQPGPSGSRLESSSRQPQVTSGGSAFAYQGSGMNPDQSEYFARRSADSYSGSGMAPGVVGTPTESYQSGGQPIFSAPTGQSAGSGSASLYQHPSMPSPMVSATGGSSTSAHTPTSGKAPALNSSAQSFSLQSQHLPSHPASSHVYGSLADTQPFGYPQQAPQHYAQHPEQHQQQAYQQSPSTTLPHLTQPLTTPHQQRPPDPNDPYGQHWQHYGS
ncbi:hypothetical protein AAFC00_004925 [Neodothiora populina]|uniref:Velvet domain-containing protein n=2 Tax=Neodothiora populina TaxID=2781224 RepID=A0ABR3P3M8_9PEZI